MNPLHDSIDSELTEEQRLLGHVPLSGIVSPSTKCRTV